MMDSKQKTYILHLFSQIQHLGVYAKKAPKSEKAKIDHELVDAEKRFSAIMNSLSSEDWAEIDAALPKTQHSRKKKTTQKVKHIANNDSIAPKHFTVPKHANESVSAGPIKDVQDRFIQKGLIKGFKKLKSLDLDFYAMESFVNTQVQEAIDQGRIGEVLSLINESGRTFHQDVLSLLKLMFQKKDYPTFLKQAHKFHYYSEIKDEIEAAIKWHVDTNKPDAFAWRVKFDNISHEETILSTNNDEYVKICENESIANNKLVTLRLTPIIRKGSSNDKVKISEDTEKYIKVQYEKCKLDQANVSHHDTQSILEDYLNIFSVPHSETKHIDVYADINGIQHIFEVKSITLRNEGTQTREAVGQLHEYAYLYGIGEPRFFLVYSSKPETEWLLDYLSVREGINVLWVDKSQKNKLAGPGLKFLEQECLKYFKNSKQDK